MEGYDEKLQQEMTPEERKKLIRGPTFQLASSVPVNAKSVFQAVTDLKPLVQSLPADRHERRK